MEGWFNYRGTVLEVLYHKKWFVQDRGSYLKKPGMVDVTGLKIENSAGGLEEVQVYTSLPDNIKNKTINVSEADNPTWTHGLTGRRKIRQIINCEEFPVEIEAEMVYTEFMKPQTATI